MEPLSLVYVSVEWSTYTQVQCNIHVINTAGLHLFIIRYLTSEKSGKGLAKAMQAHFEVSVKQRLLPNFMVYANIVVLTGTINR